MTDLKLPSVLAFNRNLEPSDALMHSGNWNDIDTPEKWQAIKLFERRNRAVKSNFKQEVLDNEEELQKQIAEANLSWGDDAALSHQHDTLKLSYSLRLVAGLEEPSVCNTPTFTDAYKEKINDLLENGLAELANRYAYNIANARFLWRNRVGAQQIQVRVTHDSLKKPINFVSYNFSLKETTSQKEDIQTLAKLIKQGLKGSDDKKNVLLKIEAFAQLGEGQRVFPSQEMVLKDDRAKTDKGKSKYLFQINGQAAMHCEKIGNALRTIDDWYPDFETTHQPIAIEAYGSVTQRGIAYRSNRTDFKTLLLKWINNKNITDEDKYFVLAMLIRGGVFGEGEDKS